MFYMSICARPEVLLTIKSTLSTSYCSRNSMYLEEYLIWILTSGHLCSIDYVLKTVGRMLKQAFGEN